MVDVREQILARLEVIIDGLDGVVKSGRNRPDVSGKARPALILHDGDEQPGGDDQAGPRNATITFMEMAPRIEILAEAASQDVGTTVNVIRAALLKAVFNDAALLELIGAADRRGNGEIRYDGCALELDSGEAREARMEISLRITYVFRIGDL